MVGDFVLDKGESLTIVAGQKGSEGLFTSGDGGGFLSDGQGNGSYTGGKSYANGLTGGVGSHNGIGGFGGGANQNNQGGVNIGQGKVKITKL